MKYTIITYEFLKKERNIVRFLYAGEEESKNMGKLKTYGQLFDAYIVDEHFVITSQFNTKPIKVFEFLKDVFDWVEKKYGVRPVVYTK